MSEQGNFQVDKEANKLATNVSPASRRYQAESGGNDKDLEEKNGDNCPRFNATNVTLAHSLKCISKIIHIMWDKSMKILGSD